MSNPNVIRGWQAAAAITGVSSTQLRRLHAKGAVIGVKGADGCFEFALADLQALRVTHGKPIAAAIAAQPAAVGANSTSGPPASAITVQSRVPNGAIPKSLLDAAENALSRAGKGGNVATVDECDDAEADRQPPACTPLGASEWGGPLFADNAPWSSNSVEKDRRIARLESELTAALSVCAAWQAAWKRERTTAIAQTMAMEAVIGNAPVPATCAARDAAAAATEQLDQQQLGDDAIALPFARSAAIKASQQVSGMLMWQQEQAAAWQAEAARQRDEEIFLARRRREHRPTRSR